MAAHYGFKKITGIDFSEKLTNVAKANMLSVKNDFQSLQYSVQTVDAADFAIPDDVDVIFLFNPFDEFVMKKVAENISISILTHRRDIFLVYENPLYKNIFLQIGFKEIYFIKKIEYLEASIFKFDQKNKPYQN